MDDVTREQCGNAGTIDDSNARGSGDKPSGKSDTGANDDTWDGNYANNVDSAKEGSQDESSDGSSSSSSGKSASRSDESSDEDDKNLSPKAKGPTLPTPIKLLTPLKQPAIEGGTPTIIVDASPPDPKGVTQEPATPLSPQMEKALSLLIMPGVNRPGLSNMHDLQDTIIITNNSSPSINANKPGQKDGSKVINPIPIKGPYTSS